MTEDVEAQSHLLAGYFLIGVRPYQLPGEHELRLPTVSNCINTCFPDTWALDWVQTPADQLQRLEADYGIGPHSLDAIREWADPAFGRGDWAWPNVLTSLEAARDAYRRFFRPLRLRLLGLALPEDQLEIALASLAPVHPREGDCGLYTMLKRGLPATPGEILGYEIMGVEQGGSLHSFYCNHLQQAYRGIGLALNVHGLLPDFASARQALELTLDEATGAEPVPWFSFRVTEYALEP